ncbi:hypothetical protein MUY32_14370 [Enterobacter roggenkampii]|uniref:hypothetical protein n=1 Tax=Enterobacter roggenkampii TaxID=1812935 RepID=UPI002019B8B9|nr:hypothetical protein [Enterobacter roggenkampii]UQQ40214.1 hypothetical protein MUY32_14370 [Enterobacter roggenkampii]
MTTSCDQQIEQPSLAQEWFTAILTGDSKKLLTYGLTKEQVKELDTTAARSDAAKLLLQSENTKARSTSKRVMAAQVLGDKETVPATTAQAGKQATFQTTATFNPSPSKSLKAA